MRLAPPTLAWSLFMLNGVLCSMCLAQSEQPSTQQATSNAIAIQPANCVSQFDPQAELDKPAEKHNEAKNNAAASTQPCIDLAWSVVPCRTERDNYGRHVSDKYYVIDVSVFNRSNGQIIIKTLTFTVQEDAVKTQPEINLDPGLVRGSIEKGQLMGRRNMIVHTIEAVGNVAAGSEGFFKAAGASASYNRIVSIWTGPFDTGIKAIWPDTTVTYLNNWDKSDVYKKGIVVESNQEGRGIIFIPFEVLQPGQKKLVPNYDPVKIKNLIGLFGVAGQTNIIARQDSFNWQFNNTGSAPKR